MPTKTLPISPSLDHLKYQARDLFHSRSSGDASVCQRIREFHPRFLNASDSEIASGKFTLSDAQLAIAREYGFASWPKLKAFVENGDRPMLDLPIHERIRDPLFRRAVDLLDAGDERGLEIHLQAHPNLVRQHVELEGGNYFRNPSLLEFSAENPIRHGTLPANIVQIAKIVLEAGAKADLARVSSTLGLVCSGRVARECGVQLPLIDLLCDYGADPDAAMGAALGHGEFEAVRNLVRSGAKSTLPVAAALGQTDKARSLLADGASAEDTHLALALAAQFGHADIERLLLASGEDPNRFNPVGAHAHSTPLHQAAFNGHLDIVRVLVEAGARLDAKDTVYGGTPLDWAEHGGKAEIAEYLQKAAESRLPNLGGVQ